MRDLTKIVLAEDDHRNAEDLRRVLEVTGGYSVWVVRKTRDIMDTLHDTNAAWLILDLELEDEPSIGIPQAVRQRWGGDVVIVTLTGFYSAYPEQRMLSDGVVLSLRKPYSPSALLAQMQSLRKMVEGRMDLATNGTRLALAGGVLDMQTGVYRGERGTFTLSKAQRLLFDALARSRDRDGWSPVERGELLIALWGAEGAQDPSRSGDRMRKLQQRLRELFGETVVVVKRGHNHTTNYSFSDAVKLMNGDDDA